MMTIKAILLGARFVAQKEVSGIRALKVQAKFAYSCLREIELVKRIVVSKQDSTIGVCRSSYPDIIGIVIWPYQCNKWDAQTRTVKLLEHCKIIDRFGAPLKFPIDQKLLLGDLSFIQPNLCLILDQSKWFFREGMLVLNLFSGQTRIYSLAFSFNEKGGRLIATVGSIQGRDLDGIAETYHELTKAAHGVRPRDLLIEAFKSFCRALNIETAMLVSDQARHHRHRYFNSDVNRKLPSNYDEIWSDRGAIRLDGDWFEISTSRVVRQFEEIPTKKRKMYRQRYEMLEHLDDRLRHQLDNPMYESASARAK